MPEYKNPLLAQVKEKQIFRTLEWQEFTYVIKDLQDENFKALLVFAYLTGARPAEIVRMTKERFEIVGKQLRVRIPTVKGGYERLIIIPICNPETMLLKQVIQKTVFPKEYVFELAKYKNPREIFIRRCNYYRLGLRDENGEFHPFTLYYFRHNIQTLLAMHGADFMLINYYVGKKLISLPKIYGTLPHYIHASLDLAKKAAKYLRKIMKGGEDEAPN